MIWVIAGTLDGRTLAVDIQERTGEEVLVTVVSQYGAELAAHKGITVHTGRLDQEAMQNLIKKHNVRLLIDASHPYAAIVTATAQDAAKAEGNLMASSEYPNIFEQRTCIQIISGGLVFHISGLPSKYGINQLLFLSIS